MPRDGRAFADRCPRFRFKRILMLERDVSRFRPMSPLPAPPNMSLRASVSSPALVSCLTWLAILAASAGLGWAGYSAGRRSLTGRVQADATRALDEQRWETAATSARTWTTLAPGDRTAWLTLASAEQGRRRFPETADALGHIPPSDPRFPNIGLLRADLLLSELGDLPAAEKTWEQVVRVDPTAAQGWQRLIYIYALTFRRDEMLETIRKAVLQRREPPEAYGYAIASRGLSFSDAVVLLLRCGEVHPENETIQVARAIAIAIAPVRDSTLLFPDPAIMPGSTAEAERLLKVYPRNPVLFDFFAERWIREGETERVRTLLGDQAANSRQPRILAVQGWLSSMDRQPDRANECFEQAVALNPLDWRSRHMWSTTLRALKKADRARHEAQLGLRGKELEREILQLQNAAAASAELMERVRQYIQDCGERELALALAERLS